MFLIDSDDESNTASTEPTGTPVYIVTVIKITTLFKNLFNFN